MARRSCCELSLTRRNLKDSAFMPRQLKSYLPMISYVCPFLDMGLGPPCHERCKEQQSHLQRPEFSRLQLNRSQMVPGSLKRHIAARCGTSPLDRSTLGRGPGESRNSSHDPLAAAAPSLRPQARPHQATGVSCENSRTPLVTRTRRTPPENLSSWTPNSSLLV